MLHTSQVVHSKRVRKKCAWIWEIQHVPSHPAFSVARFAAATAATEVHCGCERKVSAVYGQAVCLDSGNAEGRTSRAR